MAKFTRKEIKAEPNLGKGAIGTQGWLAGHGLTLCDEITVENNKKGVPVQGRPHDSQPVASGSESIKAMRYAKERALKQAPVPPERMRRLARRLHRLGPRPLYEFLVELNAGAPLLSASRSTPRSTAISSEHSTAIISRSYGWRPGESPRGGHERSATTPGALAAIALATRYFVLARGMVLATAA